jgi:hypothetical protein
MDEAITLKERYCALATSSLGEQQPSLFGGYQLTQNTFSLIKETKAFPQAGVQMEREIS